MLNLQDGPVKGVYYCKRAPVFLRAVIDTNGDKDCLDQINDLPKPTEKVYVYQLQGEAGWMHIQARGKGGKGLSGFYATGDYKHLPDVEGEALRDNSAWQEWAIRQMNDGKDGWADRTKEAGEPC